MAKKVKAANVASEINDILRDFIRDENRKVEQIMPEVAKDARRTVKAGSPGEGPYRNGWQIKYENRHLKSYGFQVWNPKHYQLTHLLENGHLIKNQYGGPFGKGRTRAIPHIGKAQEEANRLALHRLREEL